MCKHAQSRVRLHRNASSKSIGNDLYLVQANEGGDADVLFFEEGHTSLSRVDGVHHDVVEGSAARGNGHVVLLIYGSEVSLQKQVFF